MDKKNLASQAAQSVNNLTRQNLPSELAELSEEDLSQVRGGWRILDNLDNVVTFQPIEEPWCFCWSISDPDIFTHSHTDPTLFSL